MIEYLKDVPSVEELSDIIAKLKCAAHDLIRTTEPIYLEKFKGKSLNDSEWMMVMHENPILIQRPIVINGNHAVVARSSDVLEAMIKVTY